MHHYASLSSAAFTAVSLTLILSSQQATAATLFTGSSGATFGDPSVNLTTDPDAQFNVEKTSSLSETFVLGEPGPGSMANTLTFAGRPFQANPDQAFAIGDLSYFNGQTFIGTNVSSVPLDISLAFSQPTNVQQQFDYRFELDLTPNTDIRNADRLIVSNNPTPQALTHEDSRYGVELLGFSQDNGTTFSRSFQAPEDAVANSTLFAQIKLASVKQDLNPSDITETTEATDIPEPAAIPGLLVLGGTMILGKLKLKTREGSSHYC